MAGNKDNIVIKHGRIELDDCDLGFTAGGIKIERPRELEDIKLPSSGRVSGKRKVSERLFVSTVLLESSASNIDIAWDMDTGQVQTDTVHEYTLKIYVGDEDSPSYSYTKAVSVEAGEITYSKKGVAQIPVRFEILLGGTLVGAVVILAGTNMPGDFTYNIVKPKRVTLPETFGSVKRSTVAQILKDSMISFNSPKCTLAQKNAMETAYLAQVDGTVRFQGLHSEDYDCYWESMESAEEAGFWAVSGSLRISAVHT